MYEDDFGCLHTKGIYTRLCIRPAQYDRTFDR